MSIAIKSFTWILWIGIIILSACKKEKTIEPVKETIPVDTEFIETVPPVLKPNTIAISTTIGGYYSGLPYTYNDNSKRYPLLIALHGGGQYGNGAMDLPLLLNDGIPQLLDEKKFPPNFKVNGKNFSFIILAPQYSWYPAVEEIKSFIDYAVKNFRVDTTRIYFTGLSAGGSISTDVGAEYASQIAAIVPISGVYPADSNMVKKCSKIAKANLPVWIFHNINDPIVTSEQAQNYFTILKSFNQPLLPKLTLFDDSKHDAWTLAIDPAFKENKMNIYEWMLQYSR